MATTELLPVRGVLPAELTGAFVRACPHPAGLVDQHVYSGITLGGGLARWYRQEPAGGRDEPFGPRLVLPGTVQAADPVRHGNTWHTIAVHRDAGRAEHLILNQAGKTLAVQRFQLPGAPLVETVGLTERFVIVPDSALTYDRAAGILGEREPYTWRPGRPARIGLLSRTGGPVTWFETEPGHLVRLVHVFEDGDRVIVDGLRRTAGAGTSLCRWELDRDDLSVHMRPLAGAPVDQPVFVPKAGGAGGWLLTLVTGAHHSRLLVRDADDLTAPPCAEVDLPVRLPSARSSTWLNR
jgi:carotenoid cleavage dioxygenase-like enzyme